MYKWIDDFDPVGRGTEISGHLEFSVTFIGKGSAFLSSSHEIALRWKIFIKIRNWNEQSTFGMLCIQERDSGTQKWDRHNLLKI